MTDQTVGQRKRSVWHTQQIHEDHRCMLRVMAKHLDALRSPSQPEITEETLLQEMLDDVTETPPDPILPSER